MRRSTNVHRVHTYLLEIAELAYIASAVSWGKNAELAVSWGEMHTTKHDATHTDSDFSRLILHLHSCTFPFSPTAEFCTSLMDNSTSFVILELETCHGNLNIFHWCMVRSQPFAGTGRFPAGVFTFLSRWPNVYWLRARGRNCLRTFITTFKKASQEFFCAVFCNMMLSCKTWSVPHANEQQETSNVESSKLA